MSSDPHNPPRDATRSEGRIEPAAIHALDDRYDGILTRMALSGGWAALPQLEDHLGHPAAARALATELQRLGLGRLSPLRSGVGDGLSLRLHTAWALAGREEFAVATRRAGIYAAVQRLEFFHRTGRALYSPLWLGPMLLADPHADGARIEALEEAILGLFRSPYLFFDFHPDGPAIALIDVPFRPGDLSEGLAGLRAFVRHFGRAVPLWVLAESEARRAALAAEFQAGPPRVPDGVRLEVHDLDSHRWFGHDDPDAALRIGAEFRAVSSRLLTETL